MNSTGGPAGAISIDTDAVYAQVHAAYLGELQAGPDDWARLLAVTAHTLQLAPEAGAATGIAYCAALVHDVDRLTAATATGDAQGAGTAAILTVAGLDRTCVEIIERVLRDARAAPADPLPSPEARAVSDAVTSFEIRRTLIDLADAQLAEHGHEHASGDRRRRRDHPDKATGHGAGDGHARTVVLMERLDLVLTSRTIYNPRLHADLPAQAAATALRRWLAGTPAPPPRRQRGRLGQLLRRPRSAGLVR